MTQPVQWYIIMLLAGLLLLAAEVVVPGGVLGTFGALALIGAIATGFVAFGADWGTVSAILILGAAGASLVLWMKYLPRTPMGRVLTLSNDASLFKATNDYQDLEGKEGVAVTRLGPGGIAKIEGKRMDVVTEGRWIRAGAPVVVRKVSGNVITVREVESASDDV